MVVISVLAKPDNDNPAKGMQYRIRSGYSF